jgi:hypothetical protein
MLPIEGIDKIKILLNPYLVNRTSKKWNIDPYNRLTLHRAGPYLALSIHAEYFDINQDYQWQIAKAITDLINLGVLIFPSSPYLTQFIYQNPFMFMIRIVTVEFYHNLRPENIRIHEDALATEAITQYYNQDDGCYTDTYYAGVYNHKHDKSSPFIIYNKYEKDKKDNHIPYDELAEYPYKRRLEFRLNVNHTGGQWLSWFNFQGNYFDIVYRYNHLLATMYSNYLLRNIDVLGLENEELNRIIKTADDINTNVKNRCCVMGLRKTENIPVELRKPYNLKQKDIKSQRILNQTEFNKFEGNKRDKEE